AQTTDDPPAFLAREADAVKLRLRAAELHGQRLQRQTPRLAAVLCDENLVAGEQVAVLFVAEVYVVDTVGRAEALRRPTAPAVLRPKHHSAVARHPAALRVNEVDGVQVL